MKLFTMTVIAAIATTALPTVADAGPRDRLDRVEDRIDRRENIVDRQTNNGPLDRFEDVVDRLEDRRDRRGIDGPSRVDRHERRSWRRLWGNHEG